MADELSPIEIIAKGRWDNALFTTYALSLTFFETHIIKNCLVKTGCRNIWVVADVDGYQQSLAERQSARVGQEYHLVPVALSNGVFHPKCSYLSGPDGDLLMVSSGNLTFGGFGRNVEVIEMFHSRQNPGIFRQFAEFLQALDERKDFLNPDRRWISTFADMAQKVGLAQAFVGPDLPRLIHCATESVFDQIKSVFNGSGGAARLKALSPFYDAQAGAMQALAKEAKCSRLTIGLLPGREDQSTFPFGVKPAGGLKVDAALISDETDGRPLHAKWFEADLNNGNTGDAEDAEDEEVEAKPKHVLSGLQRFDAAMKMLVETILDQAQLKAAFNMWLEVELAMFTERLNDDEGAEQFCRRWHHTAVSRCRRGEAITTFDHHLFTVSATLAGNILCQNQHNADEQMARLVHLHDELERYCGGPVDDSVASAALVTEPGRIITEKVILPTAPELAASMDRLLSTRTFREEVEIVRDCAAERTEPPGDFTIFRTATGKMLLESLRRGQRIDLVEWSNGRNACPKCHLVLPESVKRTLESERIAVCPHRNHFLVHLKTA